VTNKEILGRLSDACLGQSAASTAPQMVVFVTRQDLHWERERKMNLLSRENILKHSPKDRLDGRLKKQSAYYSKVMPFLYSRFFGLIGLLRKLIVHSVGLFKPMPRQVSESDTRVVVHKTCALAAQTFMLAMADEGYDTCPMEGFDSVRVKRILNLPLGAEVNMIISCGLRAENGVFGDRVRIPFDDVYKLVN
jgi:nitroreductase